MVPGNHPQQHKSAQRPQAGLDTSSRCTGAAVPDRVRTVDYHVQQRAGHQRLEYGPALTFYALRGRFAQAEPDRSRDGDHPQRRQGNAHPVERPQQEPYGQSHGQAVQNDRQGQHVGLMRLPVMVWTHQGQAI